MSNYNLTLQSNNTDLQAILKTINELPEAGSEQATPVISVSPTNGLITATAGTKSSTYQLAFQPAKTITPTTTSQTAVSSGYYTGGKITVKGDSNLVAGNIKSGISIFGVTGNYVGSGGANTDAEDGLITRMVSVYENDRVTSIGNYAFYEYSSLISVSFPVCTNIGGNAFNDCSNLASVNFPACKSIDNNAFMYCKRLTFVGFPACTSIGVNAFYNCTSLASVNFPVCKDILPFAFENCKSLASVNFPVCKNIESRAFENCTSLTSVSFPACTSISSNVFYSCSNLSIITLGVSSVCKLANSNAFSKTVITSTTGSILVNPAYVSSYKTATNWTYFSNRIFAIGT